MKDPLAVIQRAADKLAAKRHAAIALAYKLVLELNYAKLALASSTNGDELLHEIQHIEDHYGQLSEWRPLVVELDRQADEAYDKHDVLKSRIEDIEGLLEDIEDDLILAAKFETV